MMQVLRRVEAALGAEAVGGFGIDFRADEQVIWEINQLMAAQIYSMGGILGGKYYQRYDENNVVLRFTQMHEWAKGMENNTYVQQMVAKNPQFFKWFYIFSVYCALPPDCIPSDEMRFGRKGGWTTSAKPPVLLFPRHPLWIFLYYPHRPPSIGDLHYFLVLMKTELPAFLRKEQYQRYWDLGD